MFRFPWGDFHSLNLGWFLQKFNELREDWATAEEGIDGALDAEIQKAEDALTDVFAARDAAAASASAANSSALNASQSSLASMDARDQSRAARDAAQQAAGNAAASETAAGNSATAASNSAGAAATSATQAGNSATAAGNSATAAGQSATNAAASETAAGNSAAAAAASETAAEASAQRAEEVEERIPADYTTLSNKVDELETAITQKEVNLQFAIAETGRYINWNTGGTTAAVRYSCTDFIPLNTMGAIKYKQIGITESSSGAGIAFYDENKTYLYGYSVRVAQAQFGYLTALKEQEIPQNAKYVRCTTINDTETYGTFEITGITKTAFQDITIQRLIAPVLTQMVADAALTANDFRIVNNILYRITVPVAKDGILTPGTNCVETTVGAMLKIALS